MSARALPLPHRSRTRLVVLVAVLLAGFGLTRPAGAVVSTCTLALADGQGAITTASPVQLVATFSVPVAGFLPDDLVLTGSTASTGTATITNTAGDYMTYEVSLPVTSDGTVVVSVRAGAAGDGENDVNTASNQVSVVYDATAPVLGPVTARLKGATVTVAFSASDTSAVSYTCRLDTAAPAACTSPWVLGVAAGSHTVEVVATDVAANTDTDQVAFAVKSKKIR